MRRSSRCEGRWRVVHDGYSVQTSYAIDFHPVSESLVYIVTLSDQPLTSPRRHQDGELSNRNDRTRGVPAVPRGQKKSRTRTSWLRRLGVKSSEMAVEAHQSHSISRGDRCCGMTVELPAGMLPRSSLGVQMRSGSEITVTASSSQIVDD